MYNIGHQCTSLSKVYKHIKIELNNPTQDGDHCERVSLPMGVGSSQTRLDDHPNVGRTAHSFQTIMKSMPVYLTGFLIITKRDDTISEKEYELTKETRK